MESPTDLTNSLGFRRESSLIEKVMSRKVFWLFFVALAFSYPIYRSMNRVLPPELPRLFQLPEFSLTNEMGQPFGSKEIKGRIVIASFAFTSCPTTCPGLMEKMQVVQKRVKGLGTKVALLTFTVDPENDTPEVLNKYARELNASPHIWNFLTGERTVIEKLLTENFKVPMGAYEEVVKQVDQAPVTLMDIVHTEKLALVDPEGFIRGYYSIDNNGLNSLMIDVGLLANRNYN
jgi:protein SCO1/2